jgi:acetylornithine deacetylase/succinyl-diaminopimelate desuccinylase-like protein
VKTPYFAFSKTSVFTLFIDEPFYFNPFHHFMTQIKINAQRLWDDLMALAQFTEPNTPGWTHRFPSAAYQRGRHWLRSHLETEGLTTRLDAVGNLFGRREGRESLPPIHVGSHTDTVMGGGRFDGALGVLGALARSRCPTAPSARRRRLYFRRSHRLCRRLYG